MTRINDNLHICCKSCGKILSFFEVIYYHGCITQCLYSDGLLLLSLGKLKPIRLNFNFVFFHPFQTFLMLIIHYLYHKLEQTELQLKGQQEKMEGVQALFLESGKYTNVELGKAVKISMKGYFADSPNSKPPAESKPIANADKITSLFRSDINRKNNCGL